MRAAAVQKRGRAGLQARVKATKEKSGFSPSGSVASPICHGKGCPTPSRFSKQNETGMPHVSPPLRDVGLSTERSRRVGATTAKAVRSRSAAPTRSPVEHRHSRCRRPSCPPLQNRQRWGSHFRNSLSKIQSWASPRGRPRPRSPGGYAGRILYRPALPVLSS